VNRIQVFGAFLIVFAFAITIPFAGQIEDFVLCLIWMTNLMSGFGFILVGKELLARENVIKNEVRSVSRQERNNQ
jgi:hypothetical protein